MEMEDIPITKEEYIAMVKTINQLRKEKQHLIDKAVEWIKQFAYNSVVTDHIGEREKQAIITAFKEAMEDANKESP